MKVGLISDTHGLLRPEALAALQGVDHIVHAGDIGSDAVPRALRDLASLSIIRGNNDIAAWAREIPDTLTVELDGLCFFVIHDLKDLQGKRFALPAGVDVVVSGHSHKPLVEARDQRLYVNPGSAGPRRFSLPVTIALLETGAAGPQVTIRELL